MFSFFKKIEKQKQDMNYKRNQKLARELLLFFLYTSKQKKSVILLRFNDVEITIYADGSLPTIRPLLQTELLDTNTVNIYFKGLIIEQITPKELKKLIRIFKKHNTNYKLFSIESSDILSVLYEQDK